MCPGGGKRPKTALPVMDLPAPDSPTIPTISPGAIVRLMSSNAVNTPCRVGISTRRPRTSRTGFIVSVMAFSLLQSRIDGVAQPIAQQIHREHYGNQNDAGKNADPPFAGKEVVVADADEGA